MVGLSEDVLCYKLYCYVAKNIIMRRYVTFIEEPDGPLVITNLNEDLNYDLTNCHEVFNGQ